MEQQQSKSFQHGQPDRILAVWFQMDRRGRQFLAYRTLSNALDIQQGFSRKQHFVNWDRIENLQNEIKQKLQTLLGYALAEQLRKDDLDILPLAKKLASLILPPAGLQVFTNTDERLVLELERDDTARLPWELLVPTLLVCDTCQKTCPSDGNFCSHCGAKLQEKGHPLGIVAQIPHLITGRNTFTKGGNRFLLIDDPLGDLEPDETTNTPRHVEVLREIIENHGYQTQRLRGPAATGSEFLRCLREDDLAGIYFFGHGKLDPGRHEAGLQFSDRILWAEEIQDIGRSAPFVFLNACQAGAVVEGFESGETLSMAHAFAAADENVVVAPVFPVVNRQAVEAAKSVFSSMNEHGMTASEAVREMRASSFLNYVDHQPDLAWMSYCIFGQGQFGLVESPSTTRPPDTSPEALKPPFSMKHFPENFDEILGRAFKRMVIQDRTQIDYLDLLAGLLRRSSLTRWAMMQCSIQPDNVYKRIGDSQVCETDHQVKKLVPQTISQSNQEALMRFLHDLEKSHLPDLSMFFIPEVQKFLLQWVSRGKEASELDIITGIWKAIHPETLHALGLPRWDSMQNVLQNAAAAGLDDNGGLRLDDVSEEVRKVIQHAYRLAKRRDVSEVGYRILLATLLESEQSFMARMIRHLSPETNLKTIRVFTAILLPEDTGTIGPRLDWESSRRVLLPLLARAKRLTTEPTISLSIFCKAFCQEVPQGFKAVLASESLGLDLDRLDESWDLVSDLGDNELPRPEASPEDSSSEESDDKNSETLQEAIEAITKLLLNMKEGPDSDTSETLTISPLVQTAWELASHETLYMGFREIEPIHFFLALLKIAEIEKVHPDIPGELAEMIRQEVQQLQKIFVQRNIPTTKLRRRLRSQWRQPRSSIKPGETLSRSNESRQLFEQSTHRVDQNNQPSITTPVLLDHIWAYLPQEAIKVIEDLSEGQ